MTTAGGWRQVEQWILDQQEGPTRYERLEPDLDLFETGVLTSLQVIELIVMIERAGGEKVDRMTVDEDDLRTPETIRKRFFPS